MNKFPELDSDTKTNDIAGLLQHLTKYDIIKIEKGLFEQIETNVSELEKMIKNKSYKK